MSQCYTTVHKHNYYHKRGLIKTKTTLTQQTG